MDHPTAIPQQCQNEKVPAVEETASAKTETTLPSKPSASKVTSEAESKKSSASKRPREENNVLDLAKQLGYKAGDRIEVEWDVESVEGDTAQRRWWGATLLEYETGEVEDQVAIRQIDYDPYPEGGFPFRSLERAVFVGPETLVDPETRDMFRFRREGATAAATAAAGVSSTGAEDDDDPTLVVAGNDIENVVNDTIMRAFEKNQQQWNKLEPARQHELASMVERKKRKLTELLTLRTGQGIVTASDMWSILQETMQPTSSKK